MAYGATRMGPPSSEHLVVDERQLVQDARQRRPGRAVGVDDRAGLEAAVGAEVQSGPPRPRPSRLRPLAERLITFAKRGDLHARRQVMTVIRDKDVVHKLFAEIGPKSRRRPGGYTRIVKTVPRKGDNAPMAIIELCRGAHDDSRWSRRPRRLAAPRSAPRKAADRPHGARSPRTPPAESATAAVAVADEAAATRPADDEASTRAALGLGRATTPSRTRRPTSSTSPKPAPSWPPTPESR